MVLSVSSSSFTGEIAALTAAFLWAAATLMFGRLGQQLSPLMLNIVKGLFAIALILMTLLMRPLFTSAVTGTVASQINSLPLRDILYLLLSGSIGIGLGDTAYFAAINALGARRALLLETLAPPMTAIMAWILLSEQLSIVAIAGIVMTLLGVAWVISERLPAAEQRPGMNRQQWKAGLHVALLAVFCQAFGAVLSRAALINVAVDPLWSSLLRLSAGMAFMVVLAASQPWRLGDYRLVGTDSPAIATSDASDRKFSEKESLEREPLEREPSKSPGTWEIRWQKSLQALQTRRLLGGVALAAFFGTYLGIWLQQVALKYTAAGIAQALLATSPLFILPMAALLGDRISLRSVVGVALALGGVWLLFSAG